MATEKSGTAKKLTAILKELKALSVDGVLPAKAFYKLVQENSLSQVETQKLMEGLAKL